VIVGRRKTFHALHALLRLIEADHDDLSLVRDMNVLLLKEVLRAEGNILHHKGMLKDLNARLKTTRPSRDEAKALRRAIRRTVSYVHRYQKQLYIWKCFGDGLAFAHLDKYALKHTFYGVDTYNVKQSAGMLNGKAGLADELSYLLSAIESHVPAVLCDLTNTLRYGDVCLLGASDPCLLEVKSNPKLNQRGKRQEASMKRLRTFLETDHAENFRMPGVTKRVSFKVSERTHVAAMNECIAVAERDGYSIVLPEPGLTYLAAYHRPPEGVLEGMASHGRQIIFLLDDARNSGSWAPYQPFTLSIREARHLLDFISGRVALTVLFDVDALCAALSRPGWDVEFREDVPAAIQCRHLETGARIGISQHFLNRIGYEFVSPSWIAESQAPTLEELGDALIGGVAEDGLPQEEFIAFRTAMFGPET